MPIERWDRIRSDDERRLMLVSLTEQGRSLHRRVGETLNELNRITTAGLSEKGRLELERLLFRVLENLTPETPDENVTDDLNC